MIDWHELDFEEKILFDKEERLNRDSKQIDRIKEMYDEHLHQASRFMEDLFDTFRTNDEHHVRESLRATFLNESSKIVGNLEDHKQENEQEKRKLQLKIDDLAFEKKKINFDKRGENR